MSLFIECNVCGFVGDNLQRSNHGCSAYMQQQLSKKDRRIAELESEKAETVLRMSNWAANTLHTCHDKCGRPICVANRRIAHLEALLGEAPHAPFCGYRQCAENPCNCFKARVGG